MTLHSRFGTVAFLLLALTARSQSVSLSLVQTIPIPGVKGRIDHLSIDVSGRRLFVAAMGNNTVEVIDLHKGERIASLEGFDEPQGVLYVAEWNVLFVTNGGNGKCSVFNGKSLRPASTVELQADADNIRFDAASERMYVGYGAGALSILDSSAKQLGRIQLEAHPESFQLEKNGPRIFVNVPDRNRVVVVDREKRAAVSGWILFGASANFAMALDEDGHRLFVGCRRPPVILVFDLKSGGFVAQLPIGGDADDLFYDSVHQRIYVSSGEGLLEVIQQIDADHYTTVAKVHTSKGARTSLFVPELNRIYVAAPAGEKQPSRILVYEIL